MIGPFSSAFQQAAAIRAGEISCRELLEIYKARVEQHNSSLNAIVVMDFAQAAARADELDADIARGEVRGPLHGIPMTVKESFDVPGWVTSWGSPDLKDHRPSHPATAVRRLFDAGANIFGKTNVPLFLGDLQTYNALHGMTRNPWSLDRTPGGSSGGAASAVAAGLTALEIGSDIASSIRTPAHYCGVFGHKPTFGLVTTVGQRVPGRLSVADIAVVGPLARSAVDLAETLQVVAGPDPVDGCAWSVRLPPPRKLVLHEFRVAVMLDLPHAPVDMAVRSLIEKAAAVAAEAGVEVDYEARPAIDTLEADRLFRRLFAAEFVGRWSEEQFRAACDAARCLDCDDASDQAEALRGASMSHRDWMVANEARHLMRLKWQAFFDQYDLLLCPAGATVAPLHNHVGLPFERPITVNGVEMPISRQMFWAGYAGLAYLPATVAPIGQTSDGLPAGIQIIGPQYGDLTTIEFARLLEQAGLNFSPPPNFR